MGGKEGKKCAFCAFCVSSRTFDFCPTRPLGRTCRRRCLGVPLVPLLGSSARTRTLDSPSAAPWQRPDSQSPYPVLELVRCLQSAPLTDSIPHSALLSLALFPPRLSPCARKKKSFLTFTIVSIGPRRCVLCTACLASDASHSLPRPQAPGPRAQCYYSSRPLGPPRPHSSALSALSALLARAIITRLCFLSVAHHTRAASGFVLCRGSPSRHPRAHHPPSSWPESHHLGETYCPPLFSIPIVFGASTSSHRD